MSDLDQAMAPLALGGDDELCEWYRRPDIGEQASSRPHGLCGECAYLTQNMLGARARFDDSGILEGGEGYMFQKPYSQLRDDANFCALCRAVEDSVAISQRYAAGRRPTQIPPGSHVLLDPSTSYGDLSGFHVGVAEGEDTSESDFEDSSSDTSKERFNSKPTRKDLGFLEVQVRKTGPLRLRDKGRGLVRIHGFLIRKAVSCRDMTQMLHSWLQECDSVHDVCRDHKNAAQSSTDVDASAYPTRLLEIQQVDRRFHVRLVAGSENRARYVALSHRWGDYRSIRTTTLNIESYRSGISFDTLSLTLQQAIQITFAAGVRHIWIDCLCIIQDDDNDWALEAPRMGSIYASAYFTIAASAFEGEGCFPVKFAEDHRVTIDVRPGIELNIYPRSSDFLECSSQNEPLQKRGWTLQERLLSQRILYCARYEYYWLCREQRLRAWGDPRRWFEYEMVLYGSVWITDLPLLLSFSEQSQREALTQWYQLLFDYSNRQLTLDKDKLIAINGLVDVFQRWIGSRYLHGLWECDLACGLFWYPESSDLGSGRQVKTLESRPKRAPSWSWASMDGPQVHKEAKVIWFADALEQPVSELVYVKATVASDDEHSSCLRGGCSEGPQVLKISGRLSKAFYGYENAAEKSNRVWQIKREGGAQVFRFFKDDPNFDTDEQIAGAESSKLFVLPIFAHNGLVITPASDDDVPLYRRVGACQFRFRRHEKGHLGREESEGSTAETADDETQHATVQTDDRVTEALGSTIETDTEAFDEGANAASYTDGESSSTEDTTARHEGFRNDLAEDLRWLREAGVSETIFLC